jgi:hypothetical protein
LTLGRQAVVVAGWVCGCLAVSSSVVYFSGRYLLNLLLLSVGKVTGKVVTGCDGDDGYP